MPLWFVVIIDIERTIGSSTISVSLCKFVRQSVSAREVKLVNFAHSISCLFFLPNFNFVLSLWKAIVILGDIIATDVIYLQFLLLQLNCLFYLFL